MVKYFFLLNLIVVLVFTLHPSLINCQESNRHFEQLDVLIKTAIENQMIPGAVVLVSKDGKILYQQAYGFGQKYEYGPSVHKDPPRMTIDHTFDLASLTKVLATTFAIMLLVDQGAVQLDHPVYHYIPLFRGEQKDLITVRHLLAHTAGLYPWKPVYYHARNAKESLKYICQLPLSYPVGKERHYSDLGFMLLGYLVESVSGQRLDTFLKTRLYDQLGLTKTTFNPIEGQLFAATSHGNPFEKRMVSDDTFGFLCDEDPQDFMDWREYVLIGEVNDGNAFYAHQGVAGHAGLFSTAREIKLLMDLLLNNGLYDGKRILKESTIRSFIRKDAFGNGLGWAMSVEVLPVEELPHGSFGHTGFTGTFVLAIPDEKMSIILLTNRQNMGTNSTGYYPALTELRKTVVRHLITKLTVD